MPDLPETGQLLDAEALPEQSPHVGDVRAPRRQEALAPGRRQRRDQDAAVAVVRLPADELKRLELLDDPGQRCG
ncbi:MAG: hypothetical protein M3076_13510 [Actinomycetota bacterium]|nr:hypothetical protein [Actinomycetota bacterium]